jgi:hypothetical protein
MKQLIAQLIRQSGCSYQLLISMSENDGLIPYMPDGLFSNQKSQSGKKISGP